MCLSWQNCSNGEAGRPRRLGVLIISRRQGTDGQERELQLGRFRVVSRRCEPDRCVLTPVRVERSTGRRGQSELEIEGDRAALGPIWTVFDSLQVTGSSTPCDLLKQWIVLEPQFGLAFVDVAYGGW